MKMKTRMISLSILALLTICVLNVAAASSATAPHSKIVTDAKTVTPTRLMFACPTTAQVNQSYAVSGSLTIGGKGVGGAYIWPQCVLNGQWYTFGHPYTTDFNGNFADTWTSSVAGVQHFRVIYFGDYAGQYAASVSHVVTVTVS
ncbi:MAG TPA: hypothetical protein VEG44_01690 [Candidatus Acidoferrales bacterium]|nr:hypothetical protein [Candidatus Acidoferrales bacterium]